MGETITMSDRGRGPQLSNARITVLDWMPYFQKGCGHEEIMRWLPILSHEEITVAERFYLEHKLELDEKDRRARAYREEQIRLQRLRFPEEEPEIRHARMEEALRRLRESNGAQQ
jgi:hypothetical protein